MSRAVTLSEKHKRNISKGMRGHIKSLKHRENLSKSLTGKQVSKEHRRHISEALKTKGIKPPSRLGTVPWNYRGITPLQEGIRRMFEYRQWRSDVFTRDDFTCQKCGARGVKIEAHHKKKFSVILKEYEIETIEEARNCAELWNINNGETRCIPCHRPRKKK